MNDFSWIPGTIALAAGLLGGLFLALRLKKPVAVGELDQLEDDLKLEIADLEARRDEIYSKLRGDSDEELDEAETRAFETAAARVLRDLEQARTALGKVRPAEDQRRKKGKKAPATSTQPVSSGATPLGAPATAAVHHPFLWFLAGAGLMGILAVLVIYALRDAKPDPMAAQNAAMSTGVPADHPAADSTANLPPQVRAQTEQLQAALEANPGDLNTKKQLAVLLTQYQQYLPAFQYAREILEVSPDDPDALYISSLVRLSMGQPEVSLQQIDQVLARYPQHVLGHLIRGTALIRLGRREEALAAWQDGLSAAGGSHPSIERMIAEEFGAGAAGTSPASGGSGASPAVASSAPSVEGPREYRVHVELTPGTRAVPGASLFVSVHNLEGGGPPAAVKRVADPQFPVEVSLTAQDSMMGLDLPSTGMIMVRLDSDGNPGTESPDDLSARGEGASGEVSRFVLW